MAVKAYNTITLISIDDVNISMTEPENPVLDQLWLDTSKEPNELMRYDGTGWVRTQHDSLEELDPDFKTEYDNQITSLGMTITERTTVDGEPVTEAVTDLKAGQIDITSSINSLNTDVTTINADVTTIKAGQAEFVKFSDIDGSNSTTIIDGGTIKTGTITASGGGAWFDLDEPEIVMEGTQADLSITPENPLKLTDKNGNFIGGLGVADGKLGLAAGVLTNDPNMEVYGTIGNPSMVGAVGSGITIFEKNYPEVYLGRFGAGTYGILIDDHPRLLIGDYNALYDKNLRARIFIEDETVLIDKNSVDRLYIDPNSNTFLQSGNTSHAIGVDNSGPYFTKSGAKKYLDTLAIQVSGESTVSFAQAAQNGGFSTVSSGADVLDNRVSTQIATLSSGVFCHTMSTGAGWVHGYVLMKYSNALYTGIITSPSALSHVYKFRLRSGVYGMTRIA